MESHRFRGARSSLRAIHWNEALPRGNGAEKRNCQTERERTHLRQEGEIVSNVYIDAGMQYGSDRK